MKKRKKKTYLISVRLSVFQDSNQSFVLSSNIILISLRKNAFAKHLEVLSKGMKFQYEYSPLEPPVVNCLERYVDISLASRNCILFPT